MSHEWTGGPVGFASIIGEPPQIDNLGKAYLTLRYIFPRGTGGSINQTSALVRPFQKILEEGKPTGKITFVFYQEDNNYYVLGSLVHTGRRILFFPGFVDRRVVLSPDGINPLQQGVVLTTDHYTLEQNLRTWHITLLEKASKGAKLRSMNTRKLDDMLFLWFILGIQRPNKLEGMPSSQEIRLYGNNIADLKRKFSFIMKARDESIFHITSVEDFGVDPWYLNFEFFVTTSSEKHSPQVGVTDVGGPSATIYEARNDIVTRAHRIILDGFNGSIWIRVSKIRGIISCDALTVSGR